MVQNLQSRYNALLQPSEALISEMQMLDGDIIILGVGGKMGPALAKLAKLTINKFGSAKKVIGVSRFTEPGLKDELESFGIETHEADLLSDDAIDGLPDVKNVLYLAGTKFGTTGKESLTWAMNAYLPGRIIEKYRHSRIVVFSTGNVYPLTPVIMGGATESNPAEPIGEYAQSCLGRERLFQYGSSKYQIPILLFRLNYANDVTYGVLLEIAKAVREQRPINLAMGHVNVIWQGDANEWALRSLLYCSLPGRTLNIAGPETISVRWLADEFGKIFRVSPIWVNEEQSTSLLSNAAEAFRLFGYPRVPLMAMIQLIADWISQGGKVLNKPTHFQERTGQF